MWTGPQGFGQSTVQVERIQLSQNVRQFTRHSAVTETDLEAEHVADFKGASADDAIVAVALLARGADDASA